MHCAEKRIIQKNKNCQQQQQILKINISFGSTSTDVSKYDRIGYIDEPNRLISKLEACCGTSLVLRSRKATTRINI